MSIHFYNGQDTLKNNIIGLVNITKMNSYINFIFNYCSDFILVGHIKIDQISIIFFIK